ncbi:M23 family metallopeptidase [Novosphingobium sp.]|uniref:M23 family metallopeptidase n=1 Tax=Novosphingobium sp. TaxID=1874826 RepID=UPI0026199105|nr:M23 family metallopeptidase [Novosphingobium sp.]
MSDDSFDPKQWVKQAAGTPPVRDGGSSSNEALSDFWREASGATAKPVDAAPKALPPERKKVQQSTDRRLPLAIAGSAVLLTLGATAAWMTRSTSPLPVSATVTDPEASSGLQERALNLAGPGQLVSALVAAGVRPEDASAAAAAAAPYLASGGEIHAILVLATGTDGAQLQQLRAVHIDGSGAILARAADGSYAVTPLLASVSRKIEVLRGEIDSDSFYSSAVSAGLIDSLIPEFINAFSYDFNLASEVSPGDVFEVAFDQEVNAQGQAVGQPKLLFAQLTTPQKSLALYRFETPGAEAGWFDGNGATTKRGLMRTPVDGARISSKFGMRFHPVLHYNKLHGGTDFAAPTGTPIFAAADGTIEFAAMKGANGNLTVLRHDNDWRTLYLHQNVFAPGIGAGVRVTQGQRIGDVGTTGRSTGPHLHYEVHIDGERVDPQSIPADESSRKRLEGAALQAFLKERDRIDAARSQGAS